MVDEIYVCGPTCENSDRDNVKIVQRVWKTNIVPYAIDTNAKHLSEELRQAFNIWSKVCQLRFFETDNLEGFKIRLYWVDLQQEDKLGNTHTSPEGVDIKIDSTKDWSKWDRLQTIVHEVGHALGLGHTEVSGPIMYCKQKETDRFNMLSDHDIDAVQAIYRNYNSSGNFIQSSWGDFGDFGVLVGHPNGRIYHWWRDNTYDSHEWNTTHHIPSLDSSDGQLEVSLIQSNYGRGYFEAVTLNKNGELMYVYRDDNGSWSSAQLIDSHLRGNPVLIQTRFGTVGNFEVIVPHDLGGVRHYWRDNDDPDLVWRKTSPFFKELGYIDAVSLIQSDFGDPGNLELVFRQGDELYHTTRRGTRTHDWETPTLFYKGATGIPGFIQRKGKLGNNFDLVTPIKEGGIIHLFREHSEPGFPWKNGNKFGFEQFRQASIIQSNLGDNFGNFEVIGTKLQLNPYNDPASQVVPRHFWASEPNFSWIPTI